MEDFGDILIILLFVAGSLISAVAKAFKSNKSKRSVVPSPQQSTETTYESPFDFGGFEGDNDTDEEYEDIRNIPDNDKETEYTQEIYNFSDDKSFMKEGEREIMEKGSIGSDAYAYNNKTRKHPLLKGIKLQDAILYSEIFNRKY